MSKLYMDERDKIKDDVLGENFWAENVVTELDCWISFLDSRFTKTNFDSKSEFTLFFKN